MADKSDDSENFGGKLNNCEDNDNVFHYGGMVRKRDLCSLECINPEAVPSITEHNNNNSKAPKLEAATQASIFNKVPESTKDKEMTETTSGSCHSKKVAYLVQPKAEDINVTPTYIANVSSLKEGLVEILEDREFKHLKENLPPQVFLYPTKAGTPMKIIAKSSELTRQERFLEIKNIQCATKKSVTEQNIKEEENVQTISSKPEEKGSSHIYVDVSANGMSTNKDCDETKSMDESLSKTTEECSKIKISDPTPSTNQELKSKIEDSPQKENKLSKVDAWSLPPHIPEWVSVRSLQDNHAKEWSVKPGAVKLINNNSPMQEREHTRIIPSVSEPIKTDAARSAHSEKKSTVTEPNYVQNINNSIKEPFNHSASDPYWLVKSKNNADTPKTEISTPQTGSKKAEDTNKVVGFKCSLPMKPETFSQALTHSLKVDDLKKALMQTVRAEGLSQTLKQNVKVGTLKPAVKNTLRAKGLGKALKESLRLNELKAAYMESVNLRGLFWGVKESLKLGDLGRALRQTLRAKGLGKVLKTKLHEKLNKLSKLIMKAKERRIKVSIPKPDILKKGIEETLQVGKIKHFVKPNEHLEAYKNDDVRNPAKSNVDTTAKQNDTVKTSAKSNIDTTAKQNDSVKTSAKSNIDTTAKQNDSVKTPAKSNMDTTAKQNDSVKIPAKSNIDTTAKQNDSVKIPAKSNMDTKTKQNDSVKTSAKSNIETTAKQNGSVKTSSKSNIDTTAKKNDTVKTSAKSNIDTTVKQNDSVKTPAKSNMDTTAKQNDSVKTSAKSNMDTTTKQNDTVKTSAKSNIDTTAKQNDSVKIPAKSNIETTAKQDDSVKTSAKSNIDTTAKQNDSVKIPAKSNIETTAKQNDSLKTSAKSNIDTTAKKNDTVKTSAKSNIDTTAKQNDSVKTSAKSNIDTTAKQNDTVKTSAKSNIDTTAKQNDTVKTSAKSNIDTTAKQNDTAKTPAKSNMDTTAKQDDTVKTSAKSNIETTAKQNDSGKTSAKSNMDTTAKQNDTVKTSDKSNMDTTAKQNDTVNTSAKSNMDTTAKQNDSSQLKVKSVSNNPEHSNVLKEKQVSHTEKTLKLTDSHDNKVKSIENVPVITSQSKIEHGSNVSNLKDNQVTETEKQNHNTPVSEETKKTASCSLKGHKMMCNGTLPQHCLCKNYHRQHTHIHCLTNYCLKMSLHSVAKQNIYCSNYYKSTIKVACYLNYPSILRFYFENVPHTNSTGSNSACLLYSRFSTSEASRSVKEVNIIETYNIMFDSKKLSNFIHGVNYYSSNSNLKDSTNNSKNGNKNNSDQKIKVPLESPDGNQKENKKTDGSSKITAAKSRCDVCSRLPTPKVKVDLENKGIQMTEKCAKDKSRVIQLEDKIKQCVREKKETESKAKTKKVSQDTSSENKVIENTSKASKSIPKIDCTQVKGLTNIVKDSLEKGDIHPKMYVEEMPQKNRPLVSKECENLKKAANDNNKRVTNSNCVELCKKRLQEKSDHTNDNNQPSKPSQPLSKQPTSNGSSLSGFSKYFNSETTSGRANVAKATFAIVILGVLLMKLRRKKEDD